MSEETIPVDVSESDITSLDTINQNEYPQMLFDEPQNLVMDLDLLKNCKGVEIIIDGKKHEFSMTHFKK